MKPLTIECDFHYQSQGKGSRKVIDTGPKPYRPEESGRIPRVSRLMALALRFEAMLREGIVENQAEIARLGHVTRVRVSQIMNLLNLAPEIQEAILFLPRTQRGRAPLILQQLQPIASTLDWGKQRQLWKTLYCESIRSDSSET